MTERPHDRSVTAATVAGTHVPFPYGRLDRNGTILGVNDVWLETLGYDETEVIGNWFGEYLRPDDRETFRTSFQKVLADGSTEPVALTISHANGRDVSIRFGARVERSAGDFVQVHCQFTEINSPAIDRGGDHWSRRERRAFSHTEERMQLAIEGAKLGIWDWKIKTGEVFRDELLTNMLGYSPDEMGDRLEDWEALVHPEGKSRHNEALAKHVENCTDFYQCDYRMKTSSGDWKWVRTMGKVVERDDGGDPVRAVGIHLDIDEQKRNQLKLAQKTEQLEALNRVVRHDIRSDMNVIHGWAQELEDKVNESGAEPLDRILTASRHVIELTNVAREFIESLGENDDVTLEPVDLRRQLRNEIETQRETYQEAQFTIVGELPAVTVRANQMLSSVFRNLLVNAVEHNASASPTVTVDAIVRDDSVSVRIEDNGPGIADLLKDEVFGKGEKGLEGGTGIGLYLVESLVESYEGTVWIEDNEPKGAVFVVELPIAESENG